MQACLDVAFECRARVIEQLCVQAPGEFSPLVPPSLRTGVPL